MNNENELFSKRKTITFNWKSTLIYAMFTVYWTPLAPAPKRYRIGLLFRHNDGDFGGISATERSCAALISKVEHHISVSFSDTLWCSVNRYLDRSRSK